MWTGALAIAERLVGMGVELRAGRGQEPVDVEGANLRFDPAGIKLTPSQIATAKFFVIALLLFLVQTILGGKMAHDYADGATFYGFDLNSILPFRVSSIKKNLGLCTDIIRNFIRN